MFGDNRGLRFSVRWLRLAHFFILEDIMEKQKKETLNQLYLIRALLSKSSQLSDELESCESKRKQHLDSKFIPSTSIVNLKKDLSTKGTNLGKLRKNAQEFNNSKAKEIERLKSSIDTPYNGKASIGCSFFLIGIPAIIIFYLFKWWINTNYSFWVGLLLFPVLIFSLVFVLMVLASLTPEAHIESQENDRKKLNDLLREKDELALEIKQTSKEISDIKTQLENAPFLLETEENEFLKSKRKTIEELDQTQLAIIKESVSIYEHTKSITILDERDWKILDLVIYELETGRADSIKEALQQADLYIRHNEITEVMQTATVAICSTIESSIGQLSRSIGASLSNLRAEVIGLRSEMSETTSELASKFDNLVNAQELNNALLKKANASSEQLANDVRRMRQISDEEYYKTR